MLFCGFERRVGTMPIEYEIEARDNVLWVRAWGVDDDLEASKQYGMAIAEALVAHRCVGVLCDESALVYELQTFELFELATFLTKVAPKMARAAVVVAPAYQSDAQFCENVSVNRGLFIKMFTDLEEATNWLMLGIEGAGSKEAL
jgi:hypothetical protein